MKRALITITLAVAAILPAKAQLTDYVIDAQKDAEAFAAADWGWHPIAKNMEAGYANFRMFDSWQSISVIRYREKDHRTDIFCCPGDRRSVTSRAGIENAALASMNGSYFNVKTLYPTTFMKDEGVQVGWTRPAELRRVNGVFCLKGRKGCVLEIADTSDYVAATKKYREVMAAGPVLVDNGDVKHYDSDQSFYTWRHPRTMVGVTKDGWTYLVVVDGRFPGHGEGATIAEMAFLAQQFGLYDALNLDGGGSSAIWDASDGVINHPYDNKKFDHAGEREVPNVILVF